MIYTHYDFLDLAPGASIARIETAYARVLERFGYGASESGQDMGGLVRAIHAAYEVLSDPDARRRYDVALAAEAARADAELAESLSRIEEQQRRGLRVVQDVPAQMARIFTAMAA